MNHPDLLIERLTQERDEARAALAAAEEVRQQRDEAHEKLELARRRLELILSVCRETWKDGNTRLGTIEHEAEHCLWQLPSPVDGGPGGAERSGE